MKRRHFMQSIAAGPAATTLLAQSPAARPATPTADAATSVPPPRSADELPKIDIAISDTASEPVPGFFSTGQFAALRKLCDLLQPSVDETPGAAAASAPEFLDFLISESPVERQRLYRTGLDALNSAASHRFQKPFADLDETQTSAILTPLRTAWSYEPPADPLARFLREAKQDIRTATVNSREYSAAVPSGGRRRFGGGGLYWYPLD